MASMRVHVAIVASEAAKGLLSGAKRVETRFLHDRRTPYNRVVPGEVIHFKLSSGVIIGSSLVVRVVQFADLTPARVDRLRRRFNHIVCASGAYWQARRRCRYCVFIWLGGLAPPPRRLSVPRQYGTGWLTIQRGSGGLCG